METLTHAVLDTIPGVHYSSISLGDNGGELETLAPTHSLAATVDELQYKLHEGPCFDVVAGQRMVVSNDLAADTRWPTFAPRAAEFGLGAQMAVVLVDEPRRRASLNLYSRQGGAFDVDAEVAEQLAARAAPLLMLTETIQQLDQALESHSIIGQALGIVMQRLDLDRSGAFAYLTRVSQTTNVKLRVVAGQIVEELQQSHRVTAAGRHTSTDRWLAG